MDQREMLRYAESKTAANSRGFTPATTRQLGRSESPGVPRICPDRSGASGGIHALEWVPRVPEADRLAYEEAARQAGFPSFHFREASHYKGTVPVGQRNEHFPVYYVEPYVGNEAAKGFDLGTDRTRAVALHRARDTGKPVATARITLVQDHSDHYGFLIFLPVYHNKIPHDSLEAHRQDLNGFALGVFRVADFVEAALHNLDRVGIALLIMDVTTSPDQSLLYDSARQVQGAAALASEVPKAVKPLGLQWQTTLDFAERRWEITFVPSLAYLSAHQTWQTWLALVSDFLFRALLEAFLLLVTGRSALTERTVIARTRELSESNGALKHEISVRTRAEKELEGTCIMTKILIVEVDRKFVAALSVRLRAAGYEVVVAFDAAMAGSAAVKHRPDSLFWTFRCPAVTDSWWQRDYKTLCI